MCMKILWMSDSPTVPTGFGNVTQHVCAGLADCGHQVSILGWQTQRQERWYKCTLYPFRFADHFGADAFDSAALQKYLDWLRPDVFVMQADLLRLTSTRYPVLANFMH